jgi:hypothetical protein
MKEEEMPNESTIKKGDMLTGKREPIEINPSTSTFNQFKICTNAKTVI